MVGTSKKTKKDPDYGKIRIFVYGTLKKGRPNNPVLKYAGAEFLGYDSITLDASFVDMGHFPAIIHHSDPAEKDEQATIFGEVWFGSQDIIKSTDVLEGYPLFFSRIKMFTDILHKRVWVYVLHEDWFAEVDQFVDPLIWQPDQNENKYWKAYAKKMNDAEAQLPL